MRPILRGLIQISLESAGLGFFSNQDMLRLLLHPAAVALLLSAALLFAVTLYFEMAAVVLYCDAAAGGRRIGPLPLAKAAAKRTLAALRPRNLPLVPLILVLLPLTSLRLSTAPLGSFQIPRFLMDFMLDTPSLRPLLWAAAILIELTAFLWIFTVPNMVLAGSSFREAVEESRRRIRGHFGFTLAVFAAGWLFARLAALALSGAGAAFLFGWVRLFHNGAHAREFFWDGYRLLYPWGRFLASVFDFAGSYALITVLYRRFGRRKEPSPGKGRRPKVRPLPFAVKTVLILFLLGRYVLSPAAGLSAGDLGLFGKTAVVAHRGGALFAPENTLAALRGAIESGADYAEIDVRRTRDGVLVLMHDRSLRRTAGADLFVSEADFAEVRALDAGSWFSDRFRGEPVPTLEEAIALSRGKIGLMIELKPDGDPSPLVEDAVGLIRRYGVERDCILVSSSRQVLRLVRESDPELATGLIAAVAWGDLSRLDETDAVSVELTFATEELIRSLHGSGRLAFVWTVNREDDIRRAAGLGADAIITDNPRLAQWALLPGSGRLLLTELADWAFPVPIES